MNVILVRARTMTNASLLCAQRISLALLIVAAVENGHVSADYSGAAPSSSGLTRLERDLLRRTTGAATAGADFLTSPPARNRRLRRGESS